MTKNNFLKGFSASPEEIIARYSRSKALYQEGDNLMWNTMRSVKRPLNLARNTTVLPVWIKESECFWYERAFKEGREYRLVDAKKSRNECAFDHNLLALELKIASGEIVNAHNLPISEVKISMNPLIVGFAAFDKRWTFKGGKVKELINGFDEVKESVFGVLPSNSITSPDGQKSVFTRDYNLWVRDVKSGIERQLTQDGEEFYDYAASGSSWGYSLILDLQVRWSPDSKRLFTVQKDRREVKDLSIMQYVPKDGSIRPKVDRYRIAFPGDKHVEEYRILAIDVESCQAQEAEYRRVPTTRNSAGFFQVDLGWWGKDSRKAYFIDVDRYYKFARLVEFDTSTGNTRILFEEQSDTRVSLFLNGDALPNFLPLPETNELIWYSERSGWAHFYLYDLTNGELKSTVTSGEWVARDLVRFDETRREIFITTSGRVKGRDPYYRDLVRINIDSGKITTLVSSNHEYITITPREITGLFSGNMAANGVSPSGDYAVVTRSKSDEAPVSLLIDRNGNNIMEVEKADLTGLPKNWRWPEAVKMTAADGKTDIYGVIYRPRNFDPRKSYPVIDHGFNVADMPFAPKGSFTNAIGFGSFYYDPFALAELGFIVVQIDGRGTPYRSKAFMDETYGWANSSNMLSDHVAGIKELGKRYPYMDIDRVGITTATGGAGGILGLLEHPDFYKVGVQDTLPDSRMWGSTMWGDMYEGRTPTPNQHPEEMVEKLKGKLLIMHNMLDMATPVAATFRLVHALQLAGKDFDLIVEPKPNNFRGLSPYQIRRAWDHMVRYLQGNEPPYEYKLDK
ncbi:S9 family peptidase [Paremcibacter congregatus]|nr:DPP IV N-terminal domain-containing protein [Paremcibacter congregatus]